MHIGVTFPQIEMGGDPGAVRAYAEAAEGLGYEYLLVYDHVLGADPANRPGWKGYTNADSFHEPFVLFGFLAGIAPTLEYVPGVVILPQRQTALVAKQAAEVDLLTGGKFRLGVGVGWNAVEYEALGEDFTTRGRRMEEQIEVLRLLWTQPVASFSGRFHTIVEAGLNPMPVQRPIPIWIGGMSDIAIGRAGRVADGWFPIGRVDDAMLARIDRLRAAAEGAGRLREAVGIDARIDMNATPEAEWPAEAERWRSAGATHLSINTMYQGFSPAEHIAAIGRFRKAVA